MRTAIAMTLILAQSMLPVASAADPDLESAGQPQREFATAYASLANLKRNVAEAWASSGRFPPTYSEARFDGPIDGKYFTIELGSGRDDRYAAIGAIDARGSPIWVDHPDKSDTRLEPLAHLCQDLARPIVRREDLRDEVRSERRVSTRGDLRHAAARDEREIGSPHRVRVGRDLESCVLTEDGSEGVRTNV